MSDKGGKPPPKPTPSSAMAREAREPREQRVTLESQENTSIGASNTNTTDVEQGPAIFRFHKRRATDRLMSVIPEIEKVTFRWRDINAYTTPSFNTKLKCCCNKEPLPSKQILNNVNGIAYPGELLAIMGASGAGKTTLLNILTFQRTKNLAITGSLYANGEPVLLHVFRQITAYVNQEDLFIGALTVREHLIFRARVCLDHRLNKQQKMARIDEVISDLGLSNCENTVIGIPGRLKGISGGEMKRLSFASEVLTNPSLMFCDEPTSGLDSSMASNVVQVLKRLAKKGKTIVCTIHQPSSDTYLLFDKILLMAQGRVAFIGPIGEANKFFTKVIGPCPANFNPADYFIQVLAVMPGDEDACRARVKLVCDKFQEGNPQLVSKEFPESSSTRLRNLPVKYTGSYCSKWGAVMWRAWIGFIRDPLLIQLRVLQTVLVAALLGFLFYDLKVNDPKGVLNMNSAMYIIMISISLQNAFSVINVFCEELPVFMREHKNSLYPTHIYFLSKTMIELPIFILIPFLFASITYYLMGLNIQGSRFALAMLIHILAGNVATGFGYLASTISNGISMALAIGPTVIMPLIIFGGFFLNVDSIPPYFTWLSVISWFRHGNEALMIIQWGPAEQGETALAFPGPLEGMGNPGDLILLFYDFRAENFTHNIIMLVILALGYRLLAYICLVLRTVFGK